MTSNTWKRRTLRTAIPTIAAFGGACGETVDGEPVENEQTVAAQVVLPRRDLLVGRYVRTLPA